MGKEKLNTKFNIQDPLFIADFQSNASAFGYKDYVKLSNWVDEYQYLTPDGSNTGFSANLTFKMPKRCTFLGPVQFETTYSSLSANGGGSARLVDYAGFRQINLARARYGSNILHDLDYRILYLLHRLNKSRERREAEEKLVGGNMSIWERTARGMASQSFITDIPWWWTNHPMNNVCIDALSHQLEMVITTCSAGDLSQATSGTAPTYTMTNAQMKCRLIHVEDDERDYNIDRCLHGAGVVMPFRDFETQYDNAIAGGGTQFDIQLTNLRSTFSDFRFMVQPTTNTNSPGTINNLPFSFTQISSWQINAAGLPIIDPMTDSENRDLIQPTEHSGYSGDFIYGKASALDVEDMNNSTGHDNWGGMTQPRLTIVFPSDPGASICHVITNSPNTIQQSKGDLMKNFN